MTDKGRKTTPRDFFLNLLSVIALYVSATSFGALLFQYIDILIPDVLDSASYYTDPYRAMRFPIAALLVLFPVYVFTARFLRKEYTKGPERGESGTRKWLTYFTLFVAAVVIIGDLVSVVFTFLDGEITARFIAKALSVMFIAGSVFYYYIASLKGFKDKFFKPFTGFVIAFVALAVLGSFFVVGPPSEQRERRLDQERVSDLQLIQSEIVAYWQSKDTLPSDLSELESDIRAVRVPRDPETDEPYGYSVLGELEFELCATFSADSGELEIPARTKFPGADAVWEHSAGRVCFERAIDPDFFQINEPAVVPRPIL